jgi:hypothetical protein
MGWLDSLCSHSLDKIITVPSADEVSHFPMHDPAGSPIPTSLGSIGKLVTPHNTKTDCHGLKGKVQS